MSTKKEFNIGDLVWAKVKGFPFWPATIVEPPTDAKFTPKKTRRYVFFFGSADYAWVPDENILHHSEEMLHSTSSKKKRILLKLAIKEIEYLASSLKKETAEEAPKQAKSLVKEEDSPDKKAEVSTSDPERNVAKTPIKKENIESQTVQKKVVPKRRAMGEPEYERTSPPQKLYKRKPQASKKKTTLPKLTIKPISEEAPKLPISLVKEEDSPEKKAEVSTSDPEKKVAKTPLKKENIGSQAVQKKVVPKQHAIGEPEYERTSPPLKLSKGKPQASKKKNTLPKLTIKPISEEAPKQPISLVKEEDSPEKKAEVSTSGPQKKVPKQHRKKENIGSQTVRRRVVRKRRSKGEPGDKSPPQKLSKRPREDYTELYHNTPPNINYKCLPVIRPIDDHPLSNVIRTSSGSTKHGYFEGQPVPPLNLHEPNEAIRAKNVHPSCKKIGFIGLGMMGQRFVKNLLTSNHKVTVWNRTSGKSAAFVEVGAERAETPSDIIEKCDIIFCCVSGPEASKSLVFGECGILSGLKKSPPGSKSYVEMTTLDPFTSMSIANAITEQGGRYLEAPFSGCRKSAEDGNLLILSAGAKDVFVSCESCFHTLSRNAYYLDHEVGSASKMNLILSMFKGVSYGALAEAMALVKQSNLSQENFMEIIVDDPVSSPLLTETGMAIKSRFFEANSSLKYKQRDIALALSLDNDHGLPMTITKAANDVFERAKLRNYSDHDASAVYMGTEY